MKVEFRGHNGVLGVVSLVGGRAVPDDGARKFLDSMVIVQPGEPRRLLTYDDGSRYLEALEYNLRGTYVWATSPLE